MGKFLFVDFVEENVRLSEMENKQHLRNPILSFSSSEVLDCKSHLYQRKRTGVMMEDVTKIMEHGRVALIECSLPEAIKIHEGFHD